MGVKRLPLAALLVQLGACPESIRWARRRPLSVATLRACPSAEWRQWLADKLSISVKATWKAWVAAVERSYGSGDGSGSGYGYGYGYGSGSGYGSGYGYGAGDGYGYGYGSGVRITRTYQAA